MGKMTLETEFSLGDRVWFTNPKSVRKVKQTVCKACEGDGVLIGKDKREFTSPACRGRGKLEHISYKYGPMSGTVKSILLEHGVICALEEGHRSVSIKYAVTNPKAKGCYNRDGFYIQERVFKTKKECQEHIDNMVA